MKALSNEKGIPIWLFISVPLFLMILPFIMMLIDEESKCRLIPLISSKQINEDVLGIIYFIIPFVVSIYGFYLIFKNRKLRQSVARKFYILCGVVTFNLLLPLLLYPWLWVVLIVWYGSGCYKLELKLY